MNKVYFEKIKGEGLLNFVLVHNAGGNNNFFTHQIDILKKKGDVILLDLPGHGSSTPAANNSIDDSSKVICDIYQKLALKNVYLLGLNNGANIVLNTFYKHKFPISCLILIDPPLFMNQKFIAEIEEFIHKLSQDKYEEFVHLLVTNLFIKTSKLNKDIAFNAFMQADRGSLQEMFQSLIKWDKNSSKVLQSITCPTLCIITDEHHCSYQKLKEVAPSFQLGKVVGSKCWATLEVPEQVNAMMERFIDNLENG